MAEEKEGKRVARVTLDLYLEVENAAQAEAACHTLGMLHSHIADSFPEGEPIGTDVRVWTFATPEEIQAQGLEEQ